jgi:hypothetical protein
MLLTILIIALLATLAVAYIVWIAVKDEDFWY